MQEPNIWSLFLHYVYVIIYRISKINTEKQFNNAIFNKYFICGQRIRKMKMTILILTLMTMLSGCISQQGRLSIMDFDFRKSDQIMAEAREAEAPFKNWSSPIQPENGEEVNIKAIPISWWANMLELLTKLECRVTLLSVEWTDNNKNQQ